jgi:putative peptidoglycan lipid II flippase
VIRRIINSKLLNERPTESVTAAAFIIALSGIVSRILGLLRDRILASEFGAGDTLDVYYASFRVPDLIYNLLILGALSAAFIPVFTSLFSKDKKEEAWKVAAGILNITVLVIAGISLVLVFFAPWIMKVLTPGFAPEKMKMVVLFTRIMFLSPLFLGISAVFGGVLVSLKKFLMYSLAPIFYNIGIILGVLFLVPWIGPVGLAWGVVLGAFLHMIIQYPSVKSSGFHFSLNWLESLKNDEVKAVVYLMIPRMLSIAVTQFNLTVITIFASTLRSGSLSIFNFANNIQSAPLGLFGISFAIAVFPSLSAYAAKDAKEDFIKIFSKTIRQILFFIIPISVFIIILRAQIVRLVLGSGKFDWEDTILTFSALGFLSLSLFAQSAIPLLTRSFYAFKNTKVPFYIALFSEALNISLVLLLIGDYAITGLAIAFSVSSIVNAGLLFYFLRRQTGGLDEKGIASSVLKVLIATFVAGLGVQFAKYIVGIFFDLDTFWSVLTQFVLASGIGVALFSFASIILEIDEFKQFKHSLTRKLFGAKEQIVEDSSEVRGM